MATQAGTEHRTKAIARIAGRISNPLCFHVLIVAGLPFAAETITARRAVRFDASGLARPPGQGTTEMSTVAVYCILSINTISVYCMTRRKPADPAVFYLNSCAPEIFKTMGA